MIYGSVCSGIEAASVAWHPLGWRAAFLSEIEAFPRAVLAHHYPSVPLHGDFTTIEAGQYAAIDVLVGGTPCQSFSVAGLRGGLGDDRGNLALEYLRLAQRLRPRWLVWENVPGVLSSSGGRDFGAILGGMVELGYGFAYRVLDAQYVRVDGFRRAVPQRRRRVFVVGYLGDWRRAAAVLFERESLLGNPPPRRQAGERPAPTLSARTQGGGGLGTDFDCDGGLVANEIAQTLTRGADSAGKGGYAGRRQEDDVNLVARCDTASQTRLDWETETFVADVSPTLRAGGNDTGGDRPIGTDVDTCETLVAHALRADGFDASEDGTGRGTPLVPVSFAIQAGALRENPDSGPDGVGVQEGHAYTLEARAEVQAICHAPQGVALRGRENGATAELTGDVMTALRTGGGGGDKPHVLAPVAVAFMPNESFSSGENIEVSPTLRVGSGLKDRGEGPAVALGWRVRRLMPVECERLQGFPDGYTNVPYRGKPASDGPRYKALGNSMAVNVMRWIGSRIDMVDALATPAVEAAE